MSASLINIALRRSGELSARVVAGLIIFAIGFMAVLFGTLNFNVLFFESRLTSLRDVPIYGERAVLPLLVGILVMLDGGLIAGLKRAFASGFYAVASIIWLYGAFALLSALSIPISDLAHYQPIFFTFMIAISIFVVGIILNGIPRKP